MTVLEGFICAVPRENRQAYIDHAGSAYAIFDEFGLKRHVEAWGNDVPEGKVTDFRMAVDAREDEDVIFSFFEHSDRAARDSFNARMMSDPRMEEVSKGMPFDGKRMVYGGFEAFVDEGTPGGAYIDGFVLAVPEAKRAAYEDMARKAAAVFLDHGALRDVEAWGYDVSPGEVTDFYRAVKAEEGEAVVFSFIEWPDKQTRDDGWKKVMADERMKYSPEETPFDGKRMFWGGFDSVLDLGKEAQNG
jgi:uncharacterized protein YbaA (DUF1428 family)